MKKALTIAILFAASIIALGQNPTVYLSFAPQDNGVGVRIDKDGGYMSMSYGNYKLPYGGYIKDHLKLSMGFLYKNFTLGLTYHEWGEMNETIQLEEGLEISIPLVKRNLRHLSFEAGGIVELDRFVAGFRYDVLRNEGTVDFGIKF